MGEVYHARDTRLNRDVAVKVLPASFAADDERLRRFAREAQAASALNHPNILAVFDVGTARWRPLPRVGAARGRIAPRAARRPRDCRPPRRSTSPGRSRRASRPRMRRGSPTATSSPRTCSSRPTDASRSSTSGSPYRRRSRRTPTRRKCNRSRPQASSWAPSATCRLSKFAARRRIPAPTSSPSVRSSTRCSAASARSAVRRPWRRCTPSSRRIRPSCPRPRCSRFPRSVESSAAVSRRIPRSAFSRRGILVWPSNGLRRGQDPGPRRSRRRRQRPPG